MFNCRISDILNDPFQSFAGLRYLLPFLNRVKLIPSSQILNATQGNSGIWSVGDIKKVLDQ